MHEQFIMKLRFSNYLPLESLNERTGSLNKDVARDSIFFIYFEDIGRFIVNFPRLVSNYVLLL